MGQRMHGVSWSCPGPRRSIPGISLSRAFFIILHPFFPGDPIKSSVLTFVSPWLALHAGHPGGILSAAEIVAEIRPEVPPPTSSMIRRALYSFKRHFQVPAECAATDIPIQWQKCPWRSYFPALVWKIDWEACMWLENTIVSQPSGYILHLVRCFHVPMLVG